MKCLVLAVLAVLLTACADQTPPPLLPAPGPDDPAAPSANSPYRPVMAGTAYHGVGSRP